MYKKLLMDSFDFINDMKTSEYEYLLENIRYKEIKKGEMILGNHQQCSSIPLVLKGELRIFRLSEKGREMTYYYVEPGNICILAAICTMGELEYDFTAQAEKDTLLAVINPEGFRHLLEVSSEFGKFVFLEMADKLITSFNILDEVKFTSIEDRIKDYLKKNTDINKELNITHENLAINLGTVREVVSRRLKKMEKEGLIILGRGRIKLL